MICHNCNLDKPPEEFSWHTKKENKRRKTCKVCLNVESKKYRITNNSAIKATKQQYWERNKETILKKQKMWRENNHAYTLLQQRLAYALNKEAYKSRARLRRAQKCEADGSFSLSEWYRLCVSFNNACACCKQEKKLTVDHIKPLSKGGSNWITNIQPLCSWCNTSKGAKEIRYV